MRIDYDSLRTANAIPCAASMIETFRAIGYNIETAVADIIDNSISANAKNVWVTRHWHGDKSFITIKDDGCGMNSQEIIDAMRPGSHSPLEERSKTDLGRFGLGLKTASFSQCRKSTVLSKKSGYHSAYWTWDLDYVAQTNEWTLLQWIPEYLDESVDDIEHGTLVIWSDLDKVVRKGTSENDINAKEKFSNSLDRVRQHIAMTFHRFLEEKSLKIFWCGHEIDPWNPFCISESKTQSRPTEGIVGGIKLKGYVLPHKSAFSSEKAYNVAEGINGWPAQQGFYVYRGKRLLLAGDWLGLFRKEEHYKLVRIQVDIPNTLDSEWQIDIKKSKAYPPIQCQNQLEAYAKDVRKIGCEVYRHKKKILKQRAGQSFQPLWNEKRKDNKWSFVINRDNAMIQQLKDMAHTDSDKAFNYLLRLIEETIPVKTIYINEAKGEESHKEPFEGSDTSVVKDMITRMYQNLMASNMTSEQAKAYIMTIEPLNSILEEAIILSDSILLSFKNPIYLSTVGIIDSIYLLLLVLGESLNNAFQNYYARNINNISIIGSIFKPSILIFFFISLLFSLLIIVSVKFLPPQLIGVEHYDILYTCRWYLVFLVIVTYISLSFNSILIGLGKIKGLGYISVVSIISNILLGIFLLYVWDLKINPCVVVLISSIVSECIAIILMILLIFKSQLYKEIFKV